MQVEISKVEAAELESDKTRIVVLRKEIGMLKQIHGRLYAAE